MTQELAGLLRYDSSSATKIPVVVTENYTAACVHNRFVPPARALNSWFGGVGIFRCDGMYFVPLKSPDRSNPFREFEDLLRCHEASLDSFATDISGSCHKLRETVGPVEEIIPGDYGLQSLGKVSQWEPYGLLWPKILKASHDQGRTLLTGTEGSEAIGLWPCLLQLLVDRMMNLSASEGQISRKRRRSTGHRKGAATEKIVGFLARHHGYESGRISNNTPAASADIMKTMKLPRSTVSDFLERQFASDGKPRDGYVDACRNEAKLLHWFLIQFRDGLPTQNKDLDKFDEQSIRAKF